MKAAWYERNGKAREVLTSGEMPEPKPGKGEVRVKIVASGLNPSDVKRREGTRGQNIEFPRVIPNSDGSGVVRYLFHLVLQRLARLPAPLRF